MSIGKENLNFSFDGWVKYEMANNVYGRRFDNDLTYSYLSFTKKDFATIKLGRIAVYEGNSIDLIDGFYTKIFLPRNFNVSLFSGIPTETDFDKRTSDSVLGGHLFYYDKKNFQAGLSYITEKNDGSSFREEMAVDFWLRPADIIELYGKSDYNFGESGWMSHSYNLTFKPFDQANIRFSSEWYDYKRYFSASTINLFKPGLSVINQQEKLFVFGVDVQYIFKSGLNLYADFKNYNYNVLDSANYYGANLAYAKDGVFSSGVSYHRMLGKDNKLKYHDFKVYFKKIFAEKLSSLLSLNYLKYDEPINNVNNAYNLVLSNEYKFSKKTNTSLDFEYAHNPDFEKDFRAFLKLTYRFSDI